MSSNTLWKRKLQEMQLSVKPNWTQLPIAEPGSIGSNAILLSLRRNSTCDQLLPVSGHLIIDTFGKRNQNTYYWDLKQ
ncbi:uncharacterized protein RSE6_10501 [Rhynchosporium secalis]|uniref:Uncharacterized protein n=1 Tax=Rhynchosporium secalis TaxID=38038 RepID=A0A1E1MLK2_RHYSE|nr:uncharacterized protein RSE6_10501 [Rhynchosporium secalis]